MFIKKNDFFYRHIFIHRSINTLPYHLFSGLYLYMLVVETFTAENIKLKVYTTIGWGELTISITS